MGLLRISHIRRLDGAGRGSVLAAQFAGRDPIENRLGYAPACAQQPDRCDRGGYATLLLREVWVGHGDPRLGARGATLGEPLEARPSSAAQAEREHGPGAQIARTACASPARAQLLVSR